MLLLMFGIVSANAGSACGGASWYALHSKTASGERMNPSALTAAHRTLPFGSKGAANRLGFVGAGHTNICMAKL